MTIKGPKYLLSAIALGLSVASAVGALNWRGVCIPEGKIFSAEEDLVYALVHAGRNHDYLVPDLSSAKAAEEFLVENPDCCGNSKWHDPNPISRLFGLEKNAYFLELPGRSSGKSYFVEITFRVSNCQHLKNYFVIGSKKKGLVVTFPSSEEKTLKHLYGQSTRPEQMINPH